jgi:hypothetical protein
VNAAYLVLTTAWLAGDAPAAPAPPPAAPVVSAPAGGGCGGGCGSAVDNCCDSGRQGFCARLKAKFHRSNDCGCEQAAPTCAPVKQHCAPAPAPTCCEAPARKHHHHKRDNCNTCEAAPVNDCGCGKEGLFAKLKGHFHHRGGDCGCDSGSSCGCGGNGYGNGGVITAPATGTPVETIPGAPKPGEAPRRMPATGAAPGGSVMNGVPTIVTPVVAPRLTSEQPF